MIRETKTSITLKPLEMRQPDTSKHLYIFTKWHVVVSQNNLMFWREVKIFYGSVSSTKMCVPGIGIWWHTAFRRCAFSFEVRPSVLCHHYHHHHHHHISFMELGHLLTRSGLTYPEVSSKVYHDSFCQLGSSASLPRVVYFEAFYLDVVTAVAQWLRCCATNRKVACSIPGGVIGIFYWHKILPIALWPWGRLSL